MKIIQNHLLILCIFSVLTLSCGKKIIEYSKQAEYVFINTTSHSITYIQSLERYNVGSNASVTFNKKDDGAKNVQANDYMSPFGDNDAYKNSDLKFIIMFDESRCWHPPFEGEHSPLDIKSYTNEKIANNNYRFTYIYTEADYERAVPCP